MGAYDLRTLKQSGAVGLLPIVAFSPSPDEAMSGVKLKQAHSHRATSIGGPGAEAPRIARFVGFAWIAALLLIINACFEQFVALSAVPRDYLLPQMIPAACREAAISAVAVIALTWLTATAKSRFASVALTLLAIASGTSAASHGWDPSAMGQWASAGFCAIAAFAAALSVRGAFAHHSNAKPVRNQMPITA